MATPATPALDPARANQRIFRQVLDALANPGTIRQGIAHPAVATGQAIAQPYLASLLLTLLDHEVSIHVVPGPATAGLADFLAMRTRVSLVAPENATFVAADSATCPPGLPAALRRGSLEYPDDGATLVLAVPALGRAEPAGTVTVTLEGPGIASTSSLEADPALVALLESRESAVAQYPLGIDLILVDPDGRLVGLPRTTTVRLQPGGAR